MELTIHVAPLTSWCSALSIVAMSHLLYRAGGRPLSFSRLIVGEAAALPLQRGGGECGGGKNPLLISRRKDQAGSLGTEEKTS